MAIVITNNLLIVGLVFSLSHLKTHKHCFLGDTNKIDVMVWSTRPRLNNSSPVQYNQIGIETYLLFPKLPYTYNHTVKISRDICTFSNCGFSTFSSH